MLSNLKKQLSVSSIRLLIACADMQVMQNIYAFLEPSGYQLDSAATSEETLNCLHSSPYDALVLDANFCDDNGIPLYTSLRLKHYDMPILLLVQESGSENLPRYVNGGADDIIPSPLHLVELEARIRSAVRRSRMAVAARKLSWAGIDIDMQVHEARCDGKPMKLRPTSFLLLARLVRSAPALVTREELEHELYGGTRPESDSLRTHIYQLRLALAKAGRPILTTVTHVGFRLEPWPAEEKD